MGFCFCFCIKFELWVERLVFFSVCLDGWGRGVGEIIETTNGQGFRAPRSHLGTRPGTSGLPRAVGIRQALSKRKAFRVDPARPRVVTV